MLCCGVTAWVPGAEHMWRAMFPTASAPNKIAWNAHGCQALSTPACSCVLGQWVRVLDNGVLDNGCACPNTATFGLAKPGSPVLLPHTQYGKNNHRRRHPGSTGARKQLGHPQLGNHTAIGSEHRCKAHRSLALGLLLQPTPEGQAVGTQGCRCRCRRTDHAAHGYSIDTQFKSVEDTDRPTAQPKTHSAS